MSTRLNTLLILAVPSLATAHEGHHARDSAAALLAHALGDPLHWLAAAGVLLAGGIALTLFARSVRLSANKRVKP